MEADDSEALDILEAGGRRFGVHRAQVDDVPALVALLSDDPLGSAREAASLEPYLRAFGEIEEDPQQLLTVLRDEEGEVVGTLQLSLIPGLSRGGAMRLQIEAVRVAQAARGTGLGGAMIQWAHRYGRSRGARLAQLTSDASREDAHRFYERLGYTASHVGFKRDL